MNGVPFQCFGLYIARGVAFKASIQGGTSCRECDVPSITDVTAQSGESNGPHLDLEWAGAWHVHSLRRCQPPKDGAA